MVFDGKEGHGMLLPKDRAAMIPPMGWNSWDCFAAAVNEEQLLGNAEVMAKSLRSFGWEYVVYDIQWSEPNAGTGPREYIDFARLCLDEYSRQIPAPNRFPSSANGAGFRPVAETIHRMGQIRHPHHARHSPPGRARGGKNQRHRATADQIALPSSICGWNSDMYGVDASKPGAQEYYDSLFELYAGWGVDFVKVDDICNTNLYPNNPYSAPSAAKRDRSSRLFANRFGGGAFQCPERCPGHRAPNRNPARSLRLSVSSADMSIRLKR